MVLVFSPQTVTFFYPDPKTNYPVSLYNTMITYLYNSTSPKIIEASLMMTARFFYGDICLEYNSVIHHTIF